MASSAEEAGFYAPFNGLLAANPIGGAGMESSEDFGEAAGAWNGR